jgi:hypothetical protein
MVMAAGRPTYAILFGNKGVVYAGHILWKWTDSANLKISNVDGWILYQRLDETGHPTTVTLKMFL